MVCIDWQVDSRHQVPWPGTDGEVTDLGTVRADRVAVERLHRKAGRTRELTVLLYERPDLVGLRAHADSAVTYLRWCV